jgi:hypothetical protein
MRELSEVPQLCWHRRQLVAPVVDTGSS